MVGRNLLEHHRAVGREILKPTRGELNLECRAAVDAYLSETKPDLIIHAAGVVGGIQANLSQPVRFLTGNVDLGMNIIFGAAKIGVPRLLNLGSSCIYPRNSVQALREPDIMTGELEPTNEAYALAKIMALRLCQYLGRENPTLAYKTLIPCNLYGRYDHFSEDRSHLVPAVIRKICHAFDGGLPAVEIWGDGTARREFMDAADLADAIWESVDRFQDVPDLMNIGWGSDHSIREYYEVVSSVVGFRGEFAFDLNRPVGMRRKLVSTDRLRSFGWSPKISLEQGIRSAVNYYRSLESV